jgi:hypothetical protein
MRIKEVREIAARKGLAIERSDVVGGIWLRDPKNGAYLHRPDQTPHTLLGARMYLENLPDAERWRGST